MTFRAKPLHIEPAIRAVTAMMMSLKRSTCGANLAPFRLRQAAALDRVIQPVSGFAPIRLCLCNYQVWLHFIRTPALRVLGRAVRVPE
jgi:hypothetical protein